MTDEPHPNKPFVAITPVHRRRLHVDQAYVNALGPGHTFATVREDMTRWGWTIEEIQPRPEDE